MIRDPNAEQIVTDQVGNGPTCWREMALSLADHVANESECGTLLLNPTGLVEARPVRWVMLMIANALDTAELDACDVDDAA
jgi:hypothetical protein